MMMRCIYLRNWFHLVEGVNENEGTVVHVHRSRVVGKRGGWGENIKVVNHNGQTAGSTYLSVPFSVP